MLLARPLRISCAPPRALPGCSQHTERAGHARDQAGPPDTAACDCIPTCPHRRKRENSLQEDRGSFVTTPTAELSSQEETLLGSFLDWSLDYCSGYEGDQESEGEKEGDGECRAGGRGWPGVRGLVSKEPWRAEHPALQPTGRTGCGPAGPVLSGGLHGAGTEQTHLCSQQDLSRTSCAMCPLLPCWVLSLGHPSRTGRTRLHPYVWSAICRQGEGNWRAQFKAMSMDFLVACFCVHSGLSIRWPRFVVLSSCSPCHTGVTSSLEDTPCPRLLKQREGD